MAKEQKIISLVVLLVIILGLFGFVYSYSLSQDDSLEEKRAQTTQISTIPTGVEYESNSEVDVLISSKVVNDYQAGSQIIIINEDGSKRIVKSGTLLIDGKVISQEDDSSYVYDVETQRTVSSN